MSRAYPFEDRAWEVRQAFASEPASRWVRGTGRSKVANEIVQRMRTAQSQAQFDAAAYEWKRQVLMPYYREVVYSLPKWQHDLYLKMNPTIAMRPPRQLGSYEELRKAPEFAGSQYRMRVPGDTATVPNLMRISDDPAELDIAAAGMGVTPEDLREHIREQHRAMARRRMQDDLRAMAAEGQRYRDSLANAFEESTMGSLLQMGWPELSRWGSQAIKSGNVDSWGLAKAIAKDALVGIGSGLTGGAAGAIVRNPIARSGVQGALDAAIEAGREAASDYYEVDPANIAATGAVSATLPSVIGGVAGMLGRIPGLGRVVRPIQRRLRGNMADAAEAEADAVKGMREEAAQSILQAEGGDYAAQEARNSMLDKVAGFIEESPNRVADEFPLTRETVTDIVMDPDWSKKYFEPPTRSDINKALEMRATSTADDMVELGGKLVNKSDVADEWLGKASKQWQANYDKAIKPAMPETTLDKVINAGVDAASRVETMRQRSKGQKTKDTEFSQGLKDVMGADPELIRMWEMGFAPNANDPLTYLYNEWKEKTGRK